MYQKKINFENCLFTQLEIYHLPRFLFIEIFSNRFFDTFAIKLLDEH